VFLIVAPLAAAAATQVLAGRDGRSGALGGVAQQRMLGRMVPLMMATLFVVVASQTGAISDQATKLLVLVPVYTAFLAVMAVLGSGVGKLFGFDVAARRALVFSGATRNSLVVLPLALALPSSLSLTPVVVVTQTLVELVGMVIYLRLVPVLVPQPRPQHSLP
jgi:ACR3 family arsenite transporter